MTDSTLRALWPEIDRVALCVHRPAGSTPEFRELVQRLRIPAGSMVVSAARHLTAGHVTLGQLELLARYESRSLIRLNAQRHVDLGLLEEVAEGEFMPSEPFQQTAQTVLALQGRAAEDLWAQAGDLATLADLAASVVESAAASLVVPAPAFLAQAADHDSMPTSAAGQLLAYVTDLRYLRSDLHAYALGTQKLVGPTARAVDRLWKQHPAPDEDIERLKRKSLIEDGAAGWQLTAAARQARDQAEDDTDTLSRQVLAVVPDEQVAALRHGLSRLPGDDPRPPDAR